METKDLKEYLKKVYEIEKIIYEEEMTKNYLQFKLKQPVKYHKIKPLERSSDADWTVVMVSWGAVIGAIIIAALIGNIFVWVFAIIFAGASGIVAIAVTSSEMDSARWAEKTREKNKKIREENEIAKQKNELIKLKADRGKISAETQIKLINEALCESKSIRDKYYSLELIHPKYRNIVAISSIYEYFDTEICYELTGPQGAYGRYEYMQQLKEIKTDLNIIINQLESIKRTQEMLYYAIDESNRLSKRMIEGFQRTEQKLVQTNQSLAEIKEYQRESAEYNRITACNSEFFKWITIFEKKM